MTSCLVGKFHLANFWLIDQANYALFGHKTVTINESEKGEKDELFIFTCQFSNNTPSWQILTRIILAKLNSLKK